MPINSVQNLGLIFSIQPGELSENHIGWSQGPQQILIDGLRRIYFSTRFRDGKSFVYSEVRYVDFDELLTRQVSNTSSPVISRSSPGFFDEDGIFPFHPISETLKSDGYFQALTCGWQRKQSVDIDMRIGLVETRDGGISFDRVFSGPLMGSTPDEPFLIGDPSTINFKNEIFIYYIFGTKWSLNAEEIPERQYKIGVATFLPSKSLVVGRNGLPIILDRIENEAQAMPSVINFDGLLHMFYSFRSMFNFRENSEDSYKLAHAFSEDGVNWTNTDNSFLDSTQDWDSEMQCYPAAFVNGDSIYLLYNGNSFGKLGFGCLRIDGRWLNEYSRLQSRSNQ